MNNLSNILISGCMILSIGCSTTSEDKQVKTVKKISPRQGEEVQRVCNINGWSNGERNSLIVHNSKRESYKLSLIGMCDAEWAFSKIAMSSHFGRDCITRGDKIATDANTSRGATCTVMKIHQWLPEKEKSENTDEKN
ncbi:MAG: hypothetical protein HRT53_21545 [Colwellia sp.]|nr:hypothetical protein [Colwellia sp.]